MKRFQPLVFSAALLLLAACGQNPQPAEATPSFNFSVDPGSQSVSFQGAGAEALAALQIGECGSDDPRVLFAEEELALETFEFVFLPGNILEITASFTNVTDFTFEQPFTFTQADSTNNIVSSDEPEVTDADLGGDGELGPGETTSVLTFTVEHQGQPFTYEVLAEAVVRCDDGDGEGPGGPGDDEADLEVVKTGDAEVTFDADGNATLNFNVTVTNNGTVDAENVVLTDTLTIDLSGLVDVEAIITAGLPLPDGCVVDATVADAEVIVCTIDTLAVGASADFALSFDVGLTGDLTGIESITATNTADVSSDTEESNLENNVDVAVTVLVPEAPVVPELADLTVTKEGDTEVVTNEEGVTTLDFSVTVTNNGDAIVEGVELTDTFTIDLSAFGGTAELTATFLETDCVLDADASVDDTLIAICTLGALESMGSTTLNFTFGVDLDPNLAEGETVTVTNTATATTTSDEAELADNTAVVEATITADLPLLGTPAAGS